MIAAACAQARPLVQAYVDGELDTASSLALEGHLARCEACRAEHGTLRRLRSAVGAGLAAEPAPAALRRAIGRQLRAERECARPWWRRTQALVAVPAAIVLAAAALLLAPIASERLAPTGTEKIVYHINEATDPATALRNIANHLQSSPNLRAVVVAHNNGVDFLLAGARDKDGELFEVRVAALRSHGVEFRVCGNTLTRREIAPQRVIPEAKLVPSGIAEIGRLQAREGYAYLRL